MMKKWLCILLCALLVLGSGCAVLPARSEADPAATQTGAITNVIFMIGDGMGRNHLRLAEQEGYTLFMEQNADISGWSRTRSYSHSVTDSAAGATALSCGVRITNRQLCIYPEELQKTGLRPRIITENAKEHGMRVGIVTTDKTRGATPAAYSVHTDSRDNNAEISAQQLASGFDLIWGANTSTVSVASAAEHGYIYISNLTELRALVPGERSFGQFAEDCWSLTPSEGTPTLAQMTEKSISLLSADAPGGFFLMVEGAHIDKFADDKKDDGTVDYPEKRAGAAETVASFDNAVKTAVEFARRDGHTLVIVTADHETGKLSMDETTGEYTFHSASHTDTNVPVFVYGAPDLFTGGDEMDNCSIPNLIAERLGWEERFPIDDPIDKPSTEEPSGSENNGENNPSDNSGKRTLWQRIKDWFRQFFARIAAWFGR